jgi:hypothetical protein
MAGVFTLFRNDALTKGSAKKVMVCDKIRMKINSDGFCSFFSSG